MPHRPTIASQAPLILRRAKASRSRITEAVRSHRQQDRDVRRRDGGRSEARRTFAHEQHERAAERQTYCGPPGTRCTSNAHRAGPRTRPGSRKPPWIEPSLGPRLRTGWRHRRLGGIAARTTRRPLPRDRGAPIAELHAHRVRLIAHDVSLRLTHLRQIRGHVRQLLHRRMMTRLCDDGATVGVADDDSRLRLVQSETQGRGIRHQTSRRGLSRVTARRKRDSAAHDPVRTCRRSAVALHHQPPAPTCVSKCGLHDPPLSCGPSVHVRRTSYYVK